MTQMMRALGPMAAAAGLILGSAALAGCSDDDGDGQGASCSSNEECDQSLECVDGTCVEPQANNGGPDAGDGDGGLNNDNQVEPEDYAVSYLLNDQQAGERRLMVYDTAEGTHTQVSPDADSCSQGCWLSEDLSTFVWLELADEASDELDVYSASVSDLEVQDDGEQLVSGVATAKVVENTVGYTRESGGQFSAFHQPVDGGEEVSLGNLGEERNTWFIAPEADTGVLYLPDLQTMDVTFGAIDGPSSSNTFTVDARNYQASSGAYFGQMPVAVSSDAQLGAFVTVAPNNYDECDDDSECSGPGQRCGHLGRCTAIEVTAQFVSLDDVDELGEACGGPGTCSGVHRCDQPGEEVAEAVCAPGRVVLGLPVTPQQNGQTGCELTEGNADYHYTSLDGPITFDDAGNLYGAAQRECGDADNVGDSDIIKIDPDAGSFEVVWGNPDSGYDPDACWDADQQAPSDEQCAPYITQARLSPAKNEFAFLATSPWVSEARLADNGMDLWTVMRDGTDHQWVGELESTQTTIEELHVHPLP